MSDIMVYDSSGKVIEQLYQWDKSVTITVKGASITAPIVHFCNRSSRFSIPVDTTTVSGGFTVKVPDVLLQHAEPLMAYLYMNNSRTVETFSIPVLPKKMPGDYVCDTYADYSLLVQRVTNLMIEVGDIRRNMNGTVYETAGDSVRTTDSNLAEQISDMESQIIILQSQIRALQAQIADQ